MSNDLNVVPRQESEEDKRYRELLESENKKWYNSPRERAHRAQQREIQPHDKNTKVRAFAMNSPVLYEDARAVIKLEMPRFYKLHNWGDALVEALRLLPYLKDWEPEDVWDLAFLDAWTEYNALHGTDLSARQVVKAGRTVMQVSLPTELASRAQSLRPKGDRRPISLEELLEK